jgi:hypothetical protein
MPCCLVFVAIRSAPRYESVIGRAAIAVSTRLGLEPGTLAIPRLGLGRETTPPGPNPQESTGNQRYVRCASYIEDPANRVLSGPAAPKLKIVVSPVRIWVAPSESQA